MTESTDRPAGATATESSTGELVKLASEQLSALVRSELRLAQAEMTEKGKRAGVAGGLLGGAGLVGFVAVQAAATTAIAALALALPLWVAALIVTVLLVAVAGALALTGRTQLSRALPPSPQQALGGVKADVEEIKERAHR